MDKNRLLIQAALASLALAATAAQAEMYKCVGPDGKVSFSDSRCEGGPALPATAAPAPAAPEKDAKGLTAADQQRIKALDAISVDHAANSEQKTAAQLEAGNIRRGLERSLSAADKEKREALTRQLSSADPPTRAAALRDLRALYRD